MSDDLYHDALVALARAATGAGRLEAASASATRDNPLCGDRVTFDVRVESGRVAALAHRVRGCVVCQAAAAFLASAAPGRGRSELAAARGQVAAMLEDGAAPPPGAWEGLRIFEPVGTVRSRHGCVLLPFDTLDDALRGAEE